MHRAQYLPISYLWQNIKHKVPYEKQMYYLCVEKGLVWLWKYYVHTNNMIPIVLCVNHVEEKINTNFSGSIVQKTR